MAIGADIVFDVVNRIMKRATSPAPSDTVYSANAVYSYTADVYDELTHMSYDVPQSAQTPTSYTMIGGFYIQEELTKYIDGGAIQTDGYTDEIRTLHCSATGWTDFVEADEGDLITGSVDSHTGTLLDYDNTNHKLWIRMTSATDTFTSTSENYTGAGTGTATAVAASTTGETVFANPYSLGTLDSTPDLPPLYVFQDGEKIPSWWGTDHIDILIKVKESGVEIDGQAITVFCRDWNDLYSNFYIVLTTAGQNAVPIGTDNDINNTNTTTTVAGWATTSTTAITFSFTSPFQEDVDDNGTDDNYYVKIDCGGQHLAKIYEVCKYWNRDGSTHAFKTQDDATSVYGEDYRYAYNSFVEKTVNPLGVFAGGKFFFARGVVPVNFHSDDVQNYECIDNDGNTRSPPNLQSFLVEGIESGDRVTIFLADAGAVDKTQYNIKTDQSSGAGYVDIGVNIPIDTPTAGTVIVKDSVTGAELAYAYTSWATDRFTLSGTTSSAYQAADFVFVPYIYEEATGTSVSEPVKFLTERAIITKLRLATLKPWSTLGTFGAGGYSVTASRTVDPQYTP